MGPKPRTASGSRDRTNIVLLTCRPRDNVRRMELCRSKKEKDVNEDTIARLR
jgi:hypothetical protein